MFTIDLDACPVQTELNSPLSHQDAHADVFLLRVRRGFEPADLTGMTVTGYMTFAAARQTLPVSGAAYGSTAAVTLTGDCYAVPGRFTLTIQLADGEARHTLLHVTGEITRTAEDTYISSGELLPTLPELLAQIADMQSATEDARAAANAIQGAVDDAAQAAESADAAVTQAQEAVHSAEAAAQAIEGMTASASSGAAASAAITDENGVKHLHLTIPSGKDGLSPTVTASKSGKITTLTITDTNGTSETHIHDGEDGEDGTGIASVVCTGSALSGGKGTITITLTDGTSQTFEVLNGKDGQSGTTPVKGVDYYTAAEQTGMAARVTAALPVFTLTGTDEDGTEHSWTLYGAEA